MYCKFGNFREHFIFANSAKRHICDVKESRLWHDLPISVNDRMISPYREDFIFTKMRSFAKINPRENFANLEYPNIIDDHMTLYPVAEVMSVLKGNAYGHGAVPVARHLEKHGFTYFTVATSLEGEELRQAGIKGFIQILGNMFDSLRPSQHFFRHVLAGLPGLSQY